MDIFILVLLIILNGMFAMSELALVTARKNRLSQWAEKGDKGAQSAIRLGENPTRFLSTIQIGITAIGILSGIFGEAALAAPLAGFLQQLGLSRGASSITATATVVAGITFFSIVLGELVPKRLAQLNAEGLARLAARPVAVLARLTAPFVWLLSASTDAVLRLLGKNSQDDGGLTEADLHSLLAEGEQNGAIEKQEHHLVRNALLLDDRAVVSLMTPRNSIVWMDVDMPMDEVMRTVLESDKSRFPVCRGSLDSIVGVVTAKELLERGSAKSLSDMKDALYPAIYIPESLSGMQMLDQFRASGVQMVFVVDEYGSMEGMVTLQDMLVALAGEFAPSDPEDGWAVRRHDGSWLLDGMIPVRELKECLGLALLPEEDRGLYTTLAGMLMLMSGSLPETGSILPWEDWNFEVVDLDGKRIDKVLAYKK